VLIYQVPKKYQKNRKSQTNCDNITSKNFIYRKKSNPLVQIIIESHLACVTIIAKCLRCDCHLWNMG